MEPHSTYSVMLAKIRAFRATKEIIARALEKSGITIMQWLLLGAIARNPQGFTTTKELAHELDVSMPMVTKLTAVADNRGWIKITPLKNDKRTKLITLTPTGTELIKTTEPAVKDALKEWLAPIEREHVNTYIAVLLQVAYKI